MAEFATVRGDPRNALAKTLKRNPDTLRENASFTFGDAQGGKLFHLTLILRAGVSGRIGCDGGLYCASREGN